jgi:hypothetical protein
MKTDSWDLICRRSEAFMQTRRVIYSCRTSRQNNAAYVMVLLYEKMYGNRPSGAALSKILYEHVEKNLIDIVGGKV